MKRIVILIITLTLFTQNIFSQICTDKKKIANKSINNILFVDDGTNFFSINDTTGNFSKSFYFNIPTNKPLYEDGQVQFDNRSDFITNIRVSRNPEQVIISKDNLYAFVRCFLSNTVEVIKISSREIVNSLKIPAPHHIVMSNDSTKLYVVSLVEYMITNPPKDDCGLMGFGSSGKTLLTTIDISSQNIIRCDTIHTLTIRKILKPKCDSILYLIGNNVLEFNLNSHNISRRWDFSSQIFYGEIDNKNDKIFIVSHAPNSTDSLNVIDLKTGILDKISFYSDGTSLYPSFIGIDTSEDRLFIQGKYQPYSEILVFNLASLYQSEPLQNVCLFNNSFLAAPELGSIFLTKATYEYPYNYNTVELDNHTLELKKELPTPLTNFWKTILYDKINNRLFSFQKGGGFGVLSRINPPASLDLIEYNLITGKTIKYKTTGHVYGCSYTRSMAISSDGKILIITNSPDNTISIIDLTLLNIEEKKSSKNITLFPNPSNTFIQVSINGNINNDYRVEIFNGLGQKVKYLQKSKHEAYFKIDVSELSKGQYLIKIYNSDFIYTNKFQKM